MAGSIKVAGHELVRHDIANDKLVYGTGVPVGTTLNTVVNTTTTGVDVTSQDITVGTSVGLAATITPRSTSNKLLIQVNFVFWQESLDVGLGAIIHDGASNVYADPTNYTWYANSDGTERPYRRYPFIAWITPASAGSPITYSVKIAKSGGNALKAQHNSAQSTIIIQEIKQ